MVVPIRIAMHAHVLVPTRGEGDRIKLHSARLHDQYCPPSTGKVISIMGDKKGTTCGAYGEKNAYRILVGKPEGCGLPGRQRRRSQNVKMDLKPTG